MASLLDKTADALNKYFDKKIARAGRLEQKHRINALRNKALRRLKGEPSYE